MVSLLKATCMYCHSFRLKDIKVYRFLARFKLLQAGLVSEAIALETLDFSMELNEKSDKDDEELDAVMDYDTVANAIGIALNDITKFASCFVDSYVEKAFSNHDLDMKNPRHTHSAPVTLSINYLSQVTKEFFHHMGHSKKCENCGGMAAAIRTESGTKIFEVSLNKKFAAIMESQGMRRQSVFGTREKDRVTETDSESDTGETEEEMKSGDAAGKAYSKIL
jgi:DNA-directed RNA polymerase I subunit RPA1